MGLRVVKNRCVSVLALALAFLHLLFAVDTAFAQASRLGDTFAIVSGFNRRPDTAYDPANDVYLVVTGQSSVRGRFVTPDGTPLGAQFEISSVPGTQIVPRLAYSPDAGGFLVTWLDYRIADRSRIFGRLIAFGAGGVGNPLTNEFQISAAPGGAHSEMGAAVAYATGSKLFFVAWMQYGPSNGTTDVRGQRVSNTGTLVGDEIPITADNAWQAEPSVAYNPTRDEFFVAYSYSPASGGDFVFGRQVSAGSGALGNPVQIDGGVYRSTPEIRYNSATGQYMVAWFQFTPARGYGARLLNGDGTPSGNVLTLSTTYHAYDSLAFGYNPISNSYFIATHDSVSNGPEDFGFQVSASGIPDPIFQVTASGGTGNFNPRLAVNNKRAEWLVVTSRSFQQAIGQRIQTATRAAGSAPAPTPAPSPSPAPSPTPTPTPTPTTHTLNVVRGGAGSGTVTGPGINCGSDCSEPFAAGIQVVLTPAASSGFVFAGWSGDADCFDGIVDIAGATTCIAHFNRDQGSASRRVADPNGDGIGDLFLYNQTSGLWYIAHTDTDGFNYSRGSWSRDWMIRAANLNSDDLTDYLLYNRTTGDWIQARSTGAGGFTYTGGAWSLGWDQVVIGRFNSDAFDDVFVYNSANGVWAEVWTDGAGGIGQTFSGTWDAGWQVLVGRLDTNPVDDLFLFKSDGIWVRAFSTGGGGFTYNSGRWESGYDAKIGDATGDGVDDVFLYRSSDGAWITAVNSVTGWTYKSGQWSAGWRLSVANVNRDSLDDLFLYNPTSGLYATAQSDGAGDFSAYIFGQFDAGWDVYVTDFDANQVHDIFVYNPRTGAWTKCFSNQAGGFVRFTSGQWSPDWTIVANRY